MDEKSDFFARNFAFKMKKLYMRKFLIVTIMAVLLSHVYAQYPGGAQGRGGAQIPSIGHFYGKIVDSKTNKGIDGVSVQLVKSKFDTSTRKMKDTAVAGAITQKGNFSFENLPIMASYRLKVTAIGYAPLDQKIAFDLKFNKAAAVPAAGQDNAMDNI